MAQPNLTANVNANREYLRSELEATAPLVIDDTPYRAALRALTDCEYNLTVANALTAEPATFRTFYAGIVAEVLAGRDRRMSDLRRRLRRFGYAA